jgi:protease-4
MLIVLTGVAVSAAGLVLVVFSGGTAATAVRSNSALYLDLSPPFPEIERSDVLSRLIEQPPTLRAVVDSIRSAARDERITTLVVKPGTGGAMWAQLQELRQALDEFRSSGKSLVAFLEQASTGDYFLAAAAERIVLMPAGQLDLTGVASYELFFRGTLDKIGVFPDLLHVGEYKTAANTFTEREFTDAHREMTESLNRNWYDQLVRGIAAGRRMSESEARAAIDGGPYTAEDALRAGLVDALGYEDQVDDESPVQGTRRLEGDTYLQAAARRTGGERIALLHASGTIASGESAFDSPAGVVLGSETFVDWLRRVRMDSSIRAVVVRIDSPGGSAVASEVIWRELKLTRDVKPLVVSMGDVAASGGYYIAAPAQQIVAQPGTITGSIGVVTGKFVLDGLAAELGVGVASVTDGQAAGLYSPFSRFSEIERERVEHQMQTTYDLFLSRVAEGRNLSTAEVHALGQGRVWTGEQARERGLVDELGGLDTAIRLAKQYAKIDPDREVTLVVYPPKRSIYEILANPFGTTAPDAYDLLRRPHARIAEAALSRLLLFRAGEPLALMPNVFF